MALKKQKQQIKPIEKKEGSEEQIDILKSQLARALADYDNLRRRTEEEKNIWFKVAGSRIIEKFLGIYDMIVSAQSHLNDQGLAIVLGEFKKIIEDEGYEEVKIEVGNTDFNSDLMEVVEVVTTDEEERGEKVSEVLMAGWKSKAEDTVLRHAKVKVYKFEEKSLEN